MLLNCDPPPCRTQDTAASRGLVHCRYICMCVCGRISLQCDPCCWCDAFSLPCHDAWWLHCMFTLMMWFHHTCPQTELRLIPELWLSGECHPEIKILKLVFTLLTLTYSEWNPNNELNYTQKELCWGGTAELGDDCYVIPFTSDGYKNIIPSHDLNVVMHILHTLLVPLTSTKQWLLFHSKLSLTLSNHSPSSSPTRYHRYTNITVLHLGDKVELRRTEDWGCREVIRVNGITLTAYGWLQLFKTHLRMGNFLSGVFRELPHLVVAETGTELSLQFLLCLKLFCQLPRNTCVAPLLSPFINIY